MTHETTANTIRTQFAALATTHGWTVQYDNQDLAKPENVTWCRLTIKEGDTFQASIGGATGNTDRTVGVMIAQVFSPVGIGDKAARVMADLIKAAFRRVTYTGVKFLTPSVKSIGRVESEWQVNVICPFRFDNFA